jgi:hypothetical protein
MECDSQSAASRTLTLEGSLAVILWTCIWDVLGLNLRWDTGYPA